MIYFEYNFKDADSTMIKHDKLSDCYDNLINVIKSIDNQTIYDYYSNLKQNRKSLSTTLNNLFKLKLTQNGWEKESHIFHDKEYHSGNYAFDFYKNNVGIEIAFEHKSNCTKNIMKFALAHQPNDIRKNFSIQLGIIVTANEHLKINGNFDGSIGLDEDYIKTLKVYESIVNVPLVVISLDIPDTLHIDPNSKNIVY